MTTLVIRDDDRLPGTIGFAWRFKSKEGNFHDLTWGNTKNDATLRKLLTDPDWFNHLPTRVIDERVTTQGPTPLVLPKSWGDIPLEIRP